VLRKKKLEELVLKYRSLFWLIGRQTAMSTHNKLVLYKQILKPLWTYGMELHEAEQYRHTTAIPK
jgi:hypothetical protein